MIWLDWLIVAIIGYNLVTGFMSGLMRSLVNLGALVTAYLLTPILKGFVIAILQISMMMPEYLAMPLGASLTWMGIYVLISAMGLMTVKMLHKTPLQLIDRLGGVALGLLVSSLLILLPLAAIRSLPFLQKIPPIEQNLKNSTVVPLLNPAVQFVQLTAGPAILNYWLKQNDQSKMRQSLPSPTPMPASPKRSGPTPLPRGR